MALGADIVQQYEVLRSHVLAEQGENGFNCHTISVDRLISQGLIGWSTLWERCERNNQINRLVSEQAVASDAQARLSCETITEITGILVNMTLENLNNSTTARKESKL